MPSKLPRPHTLEIRQPLTAADTARVDALDAVIILLPESALQKQNLWPEFAHSERVKKRLPEGKKALPPTRVDLPNSRGTVAVVAAYKVGASAFELLTLARKCVAKVREAEVSQLGVLLPGVVADMRVALLDAVVSAVAASNFEPPQFKASLNETRHIKGLTLFDGKQAVDFSRRLAEAEGNALARWLTLLPANHLTPTEYRSYVRDLAKRFEITRALVVILQQEAVHVHGAE